MTDSQNKLPPPQTSSRPVKKLHLFLCMLVLIIVFGLAYAYLWFFLNQSTLEQGEAIAGHAATNKQLESSVRSLTRQIDALKSQDKSLSDSQQATAKELAFNTQQLAQLSGGNRSDWLLAEAEYLLRLANQRLLLEHDVAGTELVLSAADGVLVEIDDPALLPARVALAEELLALQALPKLDRHGAFFKINALVKTIDLLPERFGKNSEERPQARPDNEQSTKPDLWNKVLAELHKVFTIRRMDTPVTPLLPPEQAYYLRQNLRLTYEQISLAILANDDLLFQSGIEKSLAWLDAHFEPGNRHVQSHRETLKGLQANTLKFEIPDISRSLKLVKARIEALYRAHLLDKETTVESQNPEDSTP